MTVMMSYSPHKGLKLVCYAMVDDFGSVYPSVASALDFRKHIHSESLCLRICDAIFKGVK